MAEPTPALPRLDDRQTSSNAHHREEGLRTRLAEAESKLTEAQEIIHAIQAGDVDAVVVSRPEGDQIFTLQGAEYAYRALVEAMHEGAATLAADGIVLYCNQRVSEIFELPLEQIIGAPIWKLVAPQTREVLEALFSQARGGQPCRTELDLQTVRSRLIPVYLSICEMESIEPRAFCMVLTDLTEHKHRDEIVAAGRLATSILESAAEAIAVCDESGRIIIANAALEQLCNCSPLFKLFDEALPLEMIEDRASPPRSFSIHIALKGKTLLAQEVLLSRQHEEPISLLLTSAPIRGSDAIVGCVLTMTDITERKRSEEAVIEQAELLELSNDSIIARDLDGTIRFWSHGAERMYGYSKQEAHGQISHNLLHTVFPQPLAEVEATLLREGRWEGDLIHTTQGGERIVVASRQVLRREDNHPACCVMEINNDITYRERAEEAVRESEGRFRALVMASSDVVYRMSPDWREMKHLVGRESIQDTDAPTGTWVERYIPADDHARIWAGIHEAIRTKGAFELEHRVLRADGSFGWTFSRAIPQLDANGEIVEWFGVASDITPRKQAEEALLRNEKLASVGRMAATIAHEINNPLEVIVQAVYLARTASGTSEQAKQYLDTAAEELDRVTHITKQTLAFHYGNNKPNLIDLRESLDSVLKLYAARLDSRGIKVEKHYADIERISGFGGEIRQVLANLISNSMDAVQKNGRIELRLSRARGRDTSRLVRFTIADTGSGIPPERLNEIFEPFFTTKEVIGTGLGLWVTKQIVEKHGATIRVRSTVGKGTAFSIAFPAPEEAMQAA